MPRDYNGLSLWPGNCAGLLKIFFNNPTRTTFVKELSTMKRSLLSAIIFALLILSVPRLGHAIPTLSLGTPIIISPTTFALPIEITDAFEVNAWSFGLTYNAAEVNINTSCDPFAGDQYCGFLPITGPVTEGDFFSSGAPNLFNPGFIPLSGGNQTGVLFGVTGEYQGSLPGPSGNGVLAYVEFLVIGSGAPNIVLTDASTTSSAVPEPTTLLLLTGGLAFLSGRGLITRRRRTDS
jgi:hypothetical protein